MDRMKIERITSITLLLVGAVFEFALCKSAFAIINEPVTAKLFRAQISEVRIEAKDSTSSLSKTNSGAWKKSGDLEDEVFSVLTDLAERQMVVHRIDKESGGKILAERRLQLEAEFIGRNDRSVGQIMWLVPKELEQTTEDHGSGEVLLLKRQRDPN